MYFYIRFLIDFDDKCRSWLLIELYNFVVLPIYGWIMVCLLFRVEVRRVLSRPGSSRKHEQNESDADGLNRRR